MQLKDYIQGNRRGKEANRLEREAMSDKFLQDALDGFDTVPSDHAQVIERLEKRIAATSATPATPQNKRKILFYGSIAASILLLIGFGVYFLSERNAINQTIVMLQHDESEMEYMTPPPSPVLSEQSEASTSKLLEEQQVQSEVLTIVENRNSIPPPSMRQEAQAEILTIVEDNVDVGNQTLMSSEDYSQSAAQISTYVPPTVRIVVSEEEQEDTAFSGKIVDELGEPIVGANIIISGTTIGALTDVNGYFTIPFPDNDSSKMIARYIGYETKEIPFSDNNIITLTPDNQVLNEVVVVGYGTQRKAVSAVSKSNNAPITFGKKEFQAYCLQKADKNVCGGKKVTVKVSFFIDETGKPTQIKCDQYTCENAKKDIESLLLSSPVWTTVNQKVTMTVKW